VPGSAQKSGFSLKGDEGEKPKSRSNKVQRTSEGYPRIKRKGQKLVFGCYFKACGKDLRKGKGGQRI